MIHHYLKTNRLLIVLLLTGMALRAQVISPFSSVYQVNQRGGIVFLSNSALGCSANPATATGTCQASSLETPLLGTTHNDDYISTYIDVDGDASTFMSSSDKLNLPACSKITKAILFWAASGSATSGFNQVKLKVNTGAYQVVTAAASQTNITGFSSYHCYADVTSLVAPAGINARVTIADIPSALVGTPNTFGSWNLVVVYQNDNMNLRQLTVFNGLANLSMTTPSVSIPLSGFLTPTLGAVGFEIGVYSHDGDRAVTGDDILFNGNLTYLPLTDLLTNPAGDVMNSTVSNNGVANALRDPLLSNTTGSDADIFVPVNLAGLYLANAATTATLMLTTTADNYLTQAITSSIDTYDPDLRATVRARDVNGGALLPGDILEYKIKGYNIGSDASANTYIMDTLDASVNYIANSTSISFGPNAGGKTDIGGDDQVDYNAVTRILKIRIGNGATAAAGGSLNGSASGVDSTVVTYSVSVSQSCLKLSCNNVIRASASVSGSGTAFPSHSFTVASTPGTSDGFGCMVQGPTTTTVSTSTCTTPTAASSSPVCAGNTLTLTASSDAEATYLWAGPASFTSALQNPTRASVSTSLSGIYSVTLSIPASTCAAIASTSVTINTCTPVAVNDFTTTSINTTVSGNAATNDINALPNGSFTIIGQPANGTVAINGATGQYTFTPATGFTGVTTATYQLCNSLPVICSTASITFTVYPLLVANPDVINTTPSVSATGNIYTNDTGLSNATVSLSVTTLPSTTGTLTVNPTTGQYTFVPNPAFTGGAQTSYTICNTSINPSQCSTTTITINVKPNPAPVNDAIATVINTSVTGNAGANDAGAATGTFAIVSQPSSGTITMNASTGQFTYTPTPTFTGITTATYNLCNGAPSTCSTAVITITVYPNIVANPDIVNTTPLTTTTGNLLGNDTGIITGGSYSVSITQPAATTGTIVLNASTGQYTFIPNPLFTGSVQSTYTVCNVGINPQQCSSTTFTIIVTNLPVAINDGTATVINTAVSGNAGSNDSGTLGGTFTFSTTSSATGTISGNPLTGAYSFTPATGFTGTISTTYTLCNLNSPPCSSATIVFTVYPTLLANADVINTTPSVSVVGNLLSNDTGITPGATYSLSVTQPPASTGTITINATTGQYTFTPNPAFTGTAQASYQVCNTSVNPQQCSSATIAINVKPNPGPVDDNLSTTVNLSVTANAAANDQGTASGSFAIVNQPANGNITMNSATGQFTFVPANNFTGVTTATYNLCNGAPSSCSTAVITITVFPDLIANPDAVTTTPSVNTSGNLLSNDGGIASGASYTVSVSQPAASTGTFVIDPATGGYTFVPNPAFTGTAQSSYTACNVSVIPQQCSSASISIWVGNAPVAVNDNTITLENTAVSGDVSTNDSYTAGGIFSFATTTAGVLTSNSVTGQYTFAPATGFTGTAAVNYTVCTSFGTCATAILSFSVYPPLVANPDNILTVMNAAATGSFETNDSGITAGGNYSLSIAALNPGVGVISVNAATGQYTFVPANGYTGSSSTTYTLTQYTGAMALQSLTTTVYIQVVPIGPPVGIAKAISHVAYNNNGTFDLTYKVVVKNYTSHELDTLAIADNLDLTFPLPTTYTITTMPSLITASGSSLALNNQFNGHSNTGISNAAQSRLAPGRVDSLFFTVKVDPHGGQYTYDNTASVSAISSSSAIADISTDGLDPDPDHDGDPGNNSTPTTFTYTLVKIGLAKSIGRSNSIGNGCYEATFKFTVKNYLNTPIYNIQVFDNLDNSFGAQAAYTVQGPVTSVNGYLVADNSYNGSSNTNMVALSSMLGAGQTDTLLLKVRYCSSTVVSFSNTATAYGCSLPFGGFIGYDISTSGLDPDPDHDGNPNESDATMFTPSEDFMIPQGFSPNGDDINDRFEIKGIAAYPQLEVSILNRWGNLVYNKKQYDNSWDGKATQGLELGGNDLPEGTYFYIVDLGNGQKPIKGFVYLNRAVR